MPELLYAAGNLPGACGSFFCSLFRLWYFAGNCAPFLFGILLETVLHPYLVFYWKPCCIPIWYFIWKPCCIPIWYFIRNRAASLFGILLETALLPIWYFIWKPCCIPIWYFIRNRAASLYGSHLPGQGAQAIRALELNKAIER